MLNLTQEIQKTHETLISNNPTKLARSLAEPTRMMFETRQRHPMGTFSQKSIKIQFEVPALMPNLAGTSRPLTLSWICLATMLGKSSKNLLPNGGLIVIYHGIIRKKSPQKTNPSHYLLLIFLREKVALVRGGPLRIHHDNLTRKSPGPHLFEQPCGKVVPFAVFECQDKP